MSKWCPVVNAPLAWRERLLWLGVLTGFWIFLASVFTVQMVLFGPFTWNQAWRFTVKDWYPWVLLSPGVMFVARRFPLESGLWAWSIPIHLATGLATVSCCALLSQWADMKLNRYPDRSLGPMPRTQALDRHGPERPLQPQGQRREPPPGPPPDRGRFRGRPRPDPFSLNHLLMRASFNLPVYCFVVSMGHAFTYLRRSRERERKALELEHRLTQSRLQALRMQLHPHFLFNTLNAISTLVHKDPAAADEMIVNLSELLRQTMEDSDQQEVPLVKELSFLDRYLEIQQVRFGDRLTVEKQVDPGILTAQVPVLILQPIVENAIRHGIEPQAEAGVISLVISRVEDRLVMSVGDTGGGLKPVAEKRGREGIGLANTRARLQALYGDRYHLSLKNGPHGGVVTQLELPYHEA